MCVYLCEVGEELRGVKGKGEESWQVLRVVIWLLIYTHLGHTQLDCCIQNVCKREKLKLYKTLSVWTPHSPDNYYFYSVILSTHRLQQLTRQNLGV